MTIRQRLQLSFGVVAFSALGIALVGWLQYRQVEGDARAIDLAGRQRMRSYQLATLASHYASYRDVVTGESIDLELRRFHQALATLERGDPGAGIEPPPSEEVAGRLRSVGELLELFETQVRSLVKKADRGDAPDLWLEKDAAVSLATSLAERADRATSAYVEASASAVESSRRLELTLFALTAVVSVLAFESMRRGVLQRLPALEEAFRDLAAGRLGAEVHLGSAPDEVGRLERAFNEMSRELEQARETILAHEAELEQKNADLVRLDELKSLFVANVSHELRTPLTSVIGFADLLRRGVYGPLTPKQEERLDGILRNARGLLDLLSDILDLASIEAGRLAIRPAPVDAAALASDVAETLRPLGDAKGLSVELRVDGAPPAVETDGARVRQILLNLGANAIKFTDRGHVRLTVAAEPEGGAVRIAVEDTGPGIPEEQLPRLFGRFEQLDGAATRRHGGTGLGLHISRRLADLLGARIEVESEPGRGSCFALILPAALSGRAAADGSA